MMHFTQIGRFICTISILLPISITAVAQNETACRFHIKSSSPNVSVNATGIVPLAPWSPLLNENQWSLAVTFNDSVMRNRDGVRFPNPVLGWLQGYMMFPKSLRDATACVYRFPGFNASSTGDTPQSSCHGVLSEGCINAIINRTGPAGGVSGHCPSFPSKEEIIEECPELEGTPGVGSTARPIDLGDKNCTWNSLPGDISMPDNFQAVPVTGVGLMEPYSPTELVEQRMLDFVYYDRFVRQTIPWLVVLNARQNTGNINEAQMVCVAPSNVTEGSRVPEGDWPPAEGSQQLDEKSENDQDSDNNESSASPTGGGRNSIWVLLLTGVIGFLGI